nr:hypothetical protein CFP56_70811 [Quercus suber]
MDQRLRLKKVVAGPGSWRRRKLAAEGLAEGGEPAATVSQRTHCRDLNGAHWNLFILNIPAESQSTNNWTVALLLIQWISFYRAVETETLTG